MARLDPHEGSEQAGSRPVIVVSRDAISLNSPVVVVVPVTDRKHKQRIYPSQVVMQPGDGGLTKESIALGEQVRAISASRLIRHMGRMQSNSMAEVSEALKIVLDL